MDTTTVRLISPARAAWLPIAASLALSALFIARSAFLVGGVVYWTLFDDAMISMQYARNLAQGHGLVWAAGQPPVEGVTNPLWTLWLALLHLLPVPEAKLPLVVMLSGAALLAANVWLVRALTQRLAPTRPAVATLAAWLTAGCYPLVYWTLRGMEVGLATVLVTALVLVALDLATHATARRLALLALLVVLALTTRLDLALPAALICLSAVLTVAPAWRWRTLVALTATGSGTLAAQTALRLWYYGAPLPNTYYLKMTGTPALTRVTVGLAWLVHLLAVSLWLPLAVAAVALLITRPRLRSGVTLLALLVVAQCAYSVYVGGDAWEWMGYANRYITPALPALLVLVALGCDALLGRLHQRAVSAAILAGAVWLLMNGDAWTTYALTNAAHVHDDETMTRYGLLLRATTAPDTTLAVAWAGAPTYWSHRNTVDLYGKSDARVAHEASQPVAFKPGHTKWDYAYSVGQLRPDVLASLAPTTPADLAALVRWGYVPLAPAIWVRADSTTVDRAALRQGLAALPALLGPPVTLAQADAAQQAPSLP